MMMARELMRSDGERSCGIVESINGEDADRFGNDMGRALLIM
jgi:hypothetical protein